VKLGITTKRLLNARSHELSPHAVNSLKSLCADILKTLQSNWQRSQASSNVWCLTV